MNAKDLEQRIEALGEAIEDLNKSRHNPSLRLEEHVRLMFDQLMYEITNGY